MTTLSIADVAKLAEAAGFTGEELHTAVAIAMAESALSPECMGDVGLEDDTWGPSVGLWQIRSLKSEYGTGGERDEAANLHPDINAVHAFAISSHGTNFEPWSTYTNGAYKTHLAEVEAALSPTPAAHPPEAAAAAPEDTHPVHYVQEGDTLSGIGLRYQRPWQVIQRLNGIKDANVIQIGEPIKLPFVYVIRPGDTLSALAERMHTTVAELAFVNQVNPNIIDAGHKLYY